MTDQLFFEDILTDTLSLHYTIAYPSHYSIKSYPLALPEYSKKQFLQTYGKLENNLAALSGINSSSLSYEESYCYGLLQNYFTIQKKGIPFAYLEEYFSPSSGIPSNFPILMAEYSFRTKQDITDYLSLLSDTPDYFSSYFEFQKERAEKGYVLASDSLQDTAEQCDTIVTQKSLEDGSHFLQVTFRERLSPLIARHIITKTQALAYIKANNVILKNKVLPAFQNLKASLLSLQKEYKPLEGLYHKTNGKEYYEWLTKKQTGCNLTIEEMLKKLELDYQKNLLEYQNLQKKITSFDHYDEYINQDFPLTEKNQILEILQSLTKQDFPSLSSFSDKPIETAIKSVSSCMEPYTSPAFYLVPPIDDIQKNTIYINNSSTPQGLDLFTTLAHEGYPGHLYQTVYFQLYSEKKEIPYIRHLMNYNGYAEGWAIYCELYSYHYAAGLYPKKLQDFYSLWHQLLLYDRKLQLGILSILDLTLHYYDDSFSAAGNLLNEYGIYDKETIKNIYQYILEEPANYLKYYMGYLCFMDLKEKAQKWMGSDFSDYKFHEFILNAGPSDFDLLENRLREWITHDQSLS